ncbi:MAG: endonuclease/exonuclease/phosphatase family protein [Actinomycetota bacterium]|nr:endonuclease/exonuclease/phosphatase family protein [Actinomycetota bacterium]
MSTSLDLPAPHVASVSVRHRRWSHLLAVGYGMAATSLLFAWWLFGDTWWTQTLNAATFWWALPGLPLAAVAALRRRWRTAAWLAVPAGIFVWSYGGLFVGSSPVVPGDVRIVAYNLFIRTPDVSHVVALARDERPDVLLLEEVLPQPAALLRAQLADRFPHAWLGESGRVGGVAVLSRHPIVEVRPVGKVGRFSRPTAVVVLEVDRRSRTDTPSRGRRRLQVVPVHLTSPCPSCGESVLERQAFEADIRREEMEAIIAALDPSLPAVVGGDFNSTRRNDPYRLLDAAGFRDPQIEAGSGPGFTWPERSPPVVRVDWIMSRGLVPTDAQVGPARASDHRPVIAELAWPE